MPIVDLRDVTADMLSEAGGKAVGLGALIRAGEHVPPGFCVTTGPLDRDHILSAYEALGAGLVAVRSSAAVEDAPDASYAGMFDTVLDVRGPDELLAAIEHCRNSATTARATAYANNTGPQAPAPRNLPAATGTTPGSAPPEPLTGMASAGRSTGAAPGEPSAGAGWRVAAEPSGAVGRGVTADPGGSDVGAGGTVIGVVVQRMVAAETAGVLFTADPVTGNRTEMLVESAASGEAVVGGTTEVDRRVLDDGDRLRRLGERLQTLFGTPQDVEWASDKDGELWILQSRPITTLFAQPPRTDGPPRVYLEFGHVQGMLQPVTPMGLDTLKDLVKAMLVPLGLRVEITGIGGRLYGDMSDLVRDPVARRRLIPLMAVDFGPRAQAVMRHVLDDPRFAPHRRRTHKRAQSSKGAQSSGSARKVADKRSGRRVPPVARAVRGVLGALVDPDKARVRLLAEVERIRLGTRDGGRVLSAAERLRLVREHDDQGHGADAIVWPIVAGMVASALPPRLLGGVARPGEIHAVLGGMPHNVTIEMDLALWSVARTATNADDADLTEFLRTYGHRAAAEVDLGVPRWAEDPAPVRAALGNLMRVTDPEQAPDVRFARAAERAEATLGELAVRARRRRPVRGRLAIFLLGRARRLAGLREAGKFAGLYRLAEMRRHLLAAGADLVASGQLNRADDIMFLTLDEADAGAGGTSSRLRELVAERRAWYERECRRRSVPVALFSDGTDVETVITTPGTPGALTGVGASAGRATGPVRVVHDPATARLEPGEVLVTATTDPGWTPLFLSAAALVTETGAVMAHGPTVAREYGLPAVICVPGATTRLRTGQIVTVDAAAGTVTVQEAR
ncbi:phosphoenolpyruvate synthase [Paractinoplanes abujensis]|uniref:Pyruvate,water dikinase n=1 Tax=Paractinoplanes abujensis TaxID=882441 RepID=A0A7W7FZM2_9ACTN|nr:PEP/pyruvate-binding domain-containing protein [Actinoplanes abujensis]MBB4690682.1 pyruvate,water dikinase [Actinoplanes abujensis]GID17905.1 phosphoenolpyruvate synthase [Actinoplanes abujensis]